MDLDVVIKKYPIVNKDWKYYSDKDVSLNSHIFMEIQYNNLPEGIYKDVTKYFARKKYKINYDSHDYTEMRLDPWNRKFKCFPFDKMVGNNTYGWDGDVARDWPVRVMVKMLQNLRYDKNKESFIY